jgi:hypothetical protein
MLTLENLFVLMLLATAGAWLWHNHGLREKALERVKQHCAKLDLELLDDAVALKRIAFVRDANGRKRLAHLCLRVHRDRRTTPPGTMTQFGAHSVQIELAPYPFEIKTPPRADNVIEMQQWRQEHNRWRN